MKTCYQGHDRAYQKRKAKGQAGWDTTEGYEEFQIIIEEAFHCIIGADREKFLASAFRVLKPGGCLMINTMCGEVTNAEMKRHFDPQSRCLVYGDIASRYIGFPEAIVEEFRKSNFTIMHREVQVRKDQNDCDNLLVMAVKSV